MAVEHLELLKERLGAKVVSTHSFRGDETACVRNDAWRSAAALLKSDAGFDMLIDLCAADYPDRAQRFEVVAHLYNVEKRKRIRLKACCDSADPKIDSLTDIFSSADWFEREAFDLFGIRFNGHPNLKRLLCHQQFEGHALRKDFEKKKRGAIPTPDTLMDEMGPEMQVQGPESRMFLNIGPSHPAMHGCFRVLVELDGERIRRAVPELGYMHRCFEKEAEAHTWHGVIPYTDRLNYVSPIMNNAGYCMAVEKLIGLEIPERAGWIRMLVCEVSRICDHLVAIGSNLVDIGAFTNFWYFFNAREAFTDWIEALCGARLTATYTRIGGLSRDMPVGSRAKLSECIKALRGAIRDVSGLIKHNRIFLDRVLGVGAISEKDAIERGFTGPCLRAAGCCYDVRKAHPYLYYSDVEWDIPVGANGDTYDRIFIRMEEMRQSTRIIEQVLEKMPEGPIITERRDVALPEPHEVYGSMEAMISHFKLCMHGIMPPAGEVYSYSEAANGELGFYIVSDGGERPYRIKVRPPCFPIYQAFPRLIEGHMVADVVAVIGSLNIIAGELDR